MKLLQKFLLFSHRYLGIAISLLVVMWFASGIVMMYSGGMPRLTPEMRFDRMPALDLTQVHLTPSEAAEKASDGKSSGRSGGGGRGGRGGAGRATLLTVMDRPAYHFAGGGSTTVFADTGERVDELTLDQSKTAASRFLGIPEEKLRFVRTLENTDQWTLGQSRQMPMHKFAADDGDGTELYIQPRTGEAAVLTTRRSRALAWIGTIPHWLYFAALRENQPLWYQIVVWTSASVCVLAVFGLVLGATLFRRTRPFKLSAAIPYKGWMRWHYVTGMVFGVFTLTWAFSGLLSMEPFAWTRATGLTVRGDTFTGGPVDLKRFNAMDPTVWNQILEGRAIKQVSYVRINGEHYFDVQHAPDDPAEAKKRERLHQPYNVTGRADKNRLLISASNLEVRSEPIPVDTLMAKLATAVPDVPVVEHAVLSQYDSYYYSRAQQTPLPVLRVKFGDPAETWVYIDPEMGQVLAAIHRLNRVERWLYNGLHSLDFSFWYDKRPLWDIGMIVLLLGGLASSVIGLFFGIKRLTRAVARSAPAVAVPAPRAEALQNQ